MTRQPGLVKRLWWNWKMLPLPWRRRKLAGFDLEGNTYWEWKIVKHAARTRRIVEYPGGVYHSDVQVPPQWAQWLRQTRFEAPTMAEQQAEALRQERIKMLAAQADARWAAKPSAVDAPDKQQPVQMLESRDPNTGIRQTNADQEIRGRVDPQPAVTEEDIEAEARQTDAAPTLKKRKPMRKEPKDSPWKQAAAKGNPGEEWQPASWSPAPARRRS
ncbi:uncharacterized protein N0V89_000370 [Didymosphaeria variabile]|uniref:NADH dehydrogenase [ubiquinone] 1 alpha subcomplex subunit n=1 Tax=Didymosphaeria variabile TaxID=1932322 RepID=A0A9W8XU62_9PLEO|nr:uncharacterized protein N0V89_000370 [Didymosphaeria variabile]KAJ4359814.1 hypothetical protein N0V89_000370 [Didymosphaeria variabile]